MVMEEEERRNEAQEKNEEEKDRDKAYKQRIWSWGAGTDGQLSTGRLEDQTLPQLLHHPSLSSSAAAASISFLACGGAHVIALTSAGKVLTWGRGNSGQLGQGEVANNVLYPKPVTSLDVIFITHVSAGWGHSGFVSDNGCLFTCGDGSFGQLGHGDYTSHCSPVKVSYFVNRFVMQIACGMRHSLVLLKGTLTMYIFLFRSLHASQEFRIFKFSNCYPALGKIFKGHCDVDSSMNQVYGFGSGKRGQLGISKERFKSISVPEVVSGFEEEEIVEIAANGDHSSAISIDGHLYTWGRGFKGCADAHSPQRLNSSLSFIKATLGWNHALALTGKGEGFMLGGNHLGVFTDPQNLSPAKQLPENSREANLEKVPGLDGIKIADTAAGAEHSALVTESREIKTWGWGEHGQLGLGDTSDQISPLTVSLGCELNEVESIRVYCGSGFTFALTMPSNPS